MKPIFRHAIIILILSCLITFMVNHIMNMWIFKIAFPEQSALQSFEFEDFAFSTRQTNEARDENIVLVNIGQLSRGAIGEQINILNQYKPKLIGVNVIFNCGGQINPKDCPQRLDSVGNNHLHNAIRNARNVVLASKLVLSQHAINNASSQDSLELSDPIFSDYAANGFANILKHESDPLGVNSCRSFVPTWNLGGTQLNSFSVEVVKKLEPIRAQRFVDRNKDEEIINYKGNISVQGAYQIGYEYYKTIDFKEVLFNTFDTSIIRDKILILGYLGDYILDNRSSEMFYSPLNRVVLGKSLPDMYGTVVQANIISMILEENYINRISPTTALIVSLIIVFINAILFSWLYPRESIWYEPLTILIPALQIVALAYLRYLLFVRWNYILDLSLAAVLLVSVSLSAGLYFGPLQKVFHKVLK